MSASALKSPFEQEKRGRDHDPGQHLLAFHGEKKELEKTKYKIIHSQSCSHGEDQEVRAYFRPVYKLF